MLSQLKSFYRFDSIIITALPNNNGMAQNQKRQELLELTKTVTFRNGLTASGEIVTEDLRLMERFFYQLRAVVKK